MEQSEMEKQIIENGFKIPPSVFTQPKENAEAITQVAPPSAEAIIEDVFSAAVVETVKHDDDIKEEIVVSAKDAIHQKTKAIQDQMQAEAKEAHFNNNKDACACFCFKDEKMLPQWAVNIMRIGYNALLVLWVAICSFTVAPTVFIFQRLSNAIKRVWVAIAVSIIIYIVLGALPIGVVIAKISEVLN